MDVVTNGSRATRWRSAKTVAHSTSCRTKMDRPLLVVFFHFFLDNNENFSGEITWKHCLHKLMYCMNKIQLPFFAFNILMSIKAIYSGTHFLSSTVFRCSQATQIEIVLSTTPCLPRRQLRASVYTRRWWQEVRACGWTFGDASKHSTLKGTRAHFGNKNRKHLKYQKKSK